MRAFETKPFLVPNARCFLALRKALTIKPLQHSSQITMQDHVEKRCVLRQMTV